MTAKFNLINILILFGIFQGILLIILINTLRRSKANIFLTMLLAAFSLNTLKMMLFDIGYFDVYPQLTFLPFFFYLIGPALYFYAKSLVGINFTANTKNIYHFIPFALNTLYYLTGLTFGNSDFLNFHNIMFRSFEELISLISVGVYLLLTMKVMKNYNIWRLDHFSDDSTQTLNWLRNLILAYSGGWFLWLIFYVLTISIGYFGLFKGSEAYYPLYIYMSVFIYWIGYSGFVKKEFSIVKISTKDEVKTRTLSAAEKNQLENLTKEIKEKKLFTKISLKLDELADHFNITPKGLSFLLNQGTNKNFYDFINELRIEEFKKKLTDPEAQNYTIQSLAEESGFKSRSTYNALFKKYVNMTPNEYKDKFQA